MKRLILKLIELQLMLTLSLIVLSQVIYLDVNLLVWPRWVATATLISVLFFIWLPKERN